MVPATISVCFTAQPDEIHALEAWRILRSSVEGLELHKEIVDELDFQLRKAFRPNSAGPLSAVSLYQNGLGCELDLEDGENQDYETDAEEDVEGQLDQAKPKIFSLGLGHDDFFRREQNENHDWSHFTTCDITMVKDLGTHGLTKGCKQ